jgi:hypothetical protein
MNEKRSCVRPRALALLAALGFLGFGLAGGAHAGFSDVPPGHWAAEAVGALSEAGILVGYPDGTFAGERALTRYEMAMIIARLLEEVGGVQGDALAPFIRVDNLEARVMALERELELAVARAEFERLQERVIVLEARLDITPPQAALPAQVPELAPEVAELEEDPAAAPLIPPVAEEALEEPGLPIAARRPLYLGVMSGFVSSAGTLAFGAQIGYDRILGPLGLAGRLFYDGGVDELRLTVNAQARFAPSDELDVYFGLGLGSLTRGGERTALVELPLGAEYFLEPQLGLVIHMVAGVPFDGGPNSGYLTAGFNIRF